MTSPIYWRGGIWSLAVHWLGCSRQGRFAALTNFTQGDLTPLNLEASWYMVF